MLAWRGNFPLRLGRTFKTHTRVLTEHYCGPVDPCIRMNVSLAQTSERAVWQVPSPLGAHISSRPLFSVPASYQSFPHSPSRPPPLYWGIWAQDIISETNLGFSNYSLTQRDAALHNPQTLLALCPLGARGRGQHPRSASLWGSVLRLQKTMSAYVSQAGAGPS